jgi:hypothetical protein
MKLTKLSAAPEHGRLAWLPLRCRLMPARPAYDAGTASQLIPGVGPTLMGDRRGRGNTAAVSRPGCGEGERLMVQWEWTAHA